MGRWSHSRLQTLLDCPMKYKHKYKNRMSTRGIIIPFLVGTAVHQFKETHYQFRGKKPKLALSRAKKEFDKVLSKEKKNLSSDQIHDISCQAAMVEGICRAYPKHYKDDFRRFKVFLTEQTAEIMLGDEVYHGYIDCLVQDVHGDWWVLETKTAAQINASYLDKVQIDSQVTGYMWLAREILGEFPKGVIYDVIKKPGIRLKKAETKQAYTRRVVDEYIKHGAVKNMLVREEVLIHDRQLKRWKKNMAATLKWAAGLTTYHMNTGACLPMYGACGFLDACCSGKYNKMRYVKKDD